MVRRDGTYRCIRWDIQSNAEEQRTHLVGVDISDHEPIVTDNGFWSVPGTARAAPGPGHLQRDRMLSLYARGDLSEDRWQRQDRELREQEEPLEHRLADLTRARPLASVPDLATARRRWDEGGVHWWRAFLSALIRSVKVNRHPLASPRH
jgi:hypothetical protein